MPNVAQHFAELFSQVKAKKKFSGIGREVWPESNNPSDRVRMIYERRNNAPWELIDYILNSTVMAPEPINRVAEALRSAGVTEEKAQPVLEIVRGMLPSTRQSGAPTAPARLTPQLVAQLQAQLEDVVQQLALVEASPKTGDQTRDTLNKISSELHKLTAHLSGQSEDRASQKSTADSTGKATDASV